MLGIGFAIAIIFNVDTLRIVDAVSKNPNLAKAVAAEAESYASSHNPTSDGTNRGNGERKLEEAIARLEDQASRWVGMQPSGSTWAWNARKSLADCFGANDASSSCRWEAGSSRREPPRSGAPFWFDVLSRFVNLRNAGKDPNEKDPITSVKASGQANLNKTPCANCALNQRKNAKQ